MSKHSLCNGLFQLGSLLTSGWKYPNLESFYGFEKIFYSFGRNEWSQFFELKKKNGCSVCSGTASVKTMQWVKFVIAVTTFIPSTLCPNFPFLRVDLPFWFSQFTPHPPNQFSERTVYGYALSRLTSQQPLCTILTVLCDWSLSLGGCHFQGLFVCKKLKPTTTNLST